ncbi:hypothetical protein ACOSQ2_012624 [Xanthoceras sorbifolium]
MSSLSDQECHKADTSGSPNVGDRSSRPFNEVVDAYERFVSRERAMDYGDRAVTSHGSKATRSSTSGHVEARGDQRESTGVSTSGDQGENKGVIPIAEKVDDPSLSISEELQSQAGDFLYPSSLIKREDLVGLAHTFHPSMGHRVLIPDTFTTRGINSNCRICRSNKFS